MATSQITAQITPPQVPKSEEPTKDAPLQSPQQQQQGQQKTSRDEQNLQQYGPSLIAQIQKSRATWEYKRRGIIQCVITNKEMKKGNQNIGFLPGSTEIFDAFQQYNSLTGAANPEQGDRSLDQRPHN